MTEPTVFDAVNAALAEVSGDAPTKTQNTDVDDSPSNPHADAEDQYTELGVDEASDKTGEEGGETETSDGEDAGEDEGTPGKSDGAADKPADGKGDTDEAKAAAEAAAAAAAKKPDALNDPVPKDVAPATQERIRTLIKATKEAETQRAEATQNLDFIVNGVKGAGMSPAQFGETLSFMSVYNSGNFEKAIEMLEPFLDNMYALAGKERPAHDPLKGFPDLAEAVRVGHMTRQWASQLAASRRQQQTRSTIETSQRTAQEQEAAQTAEVEKARSEMNAWEIATAAKDPQFEVKKAAILKQSKSIIKRLPPSQWLGAFQEAYKNAPANPGAALAQLRKGPVKGKVPDNQPLRARNPAGGGAHAPKNMQDAVFGAIADLAGSRR